LNQKNIWIICQYAGSKYHGMGYRQYYLAKTLIKNGYNVYIFSGSYSHLYIELPDVKGNFTFEIIDNINYIWVKIPKYKKSKSIGRALSMVFFMLKLFMYNTKKTPKPEIIIVSSPSPFPIINAWLWAKRFKSKLIFEVRDIWPLTLIELGNFSKYNPFVLFMQLFENFAYKKIDYVVSVLPKAKEHMIKHGLDEKKFIYIPNGIDLEEVKNIEPLEKDTIKKIPKDKFIVGYIGTIGIANALEYFIKAANILNRIKNIYFIIVGNGGEKEKLVRMANGLDNVIFIDAVRKSQVQYILNLFDVCYMGWRNKKIYRFGTSPNKIFDYMYAGKPILYSINSGNNIVNEANCGVSVEAENPEAIAKGILKLYKLSQEDRNQLGENAKDFVIKNHSYGHLVKRYIKLFS